MDWLLELMILYWKENVLLLKKLTAILVLS